MHITAWGYIDLSLHCWAQYWRFGPTTWITQQNWSNFNLAKCNDRVLQWWFCSVKASASLKWSIEVILCIELKQSYCEILESVPAVFGNLSWNFRPSLSVCSSFAGNHQYITGYDLFWWLVSEKIVICLQRSGTKLGQTEFDIHNMILCMFVI